MVKHTQTIRRQTVDELFEFVWPFCGIGASRVNLFQRECVELLLENGCDINICDADDNTLLIHAGIKGYKSICEVLLGHGVDINATNKVIFFIWIYQKIFNPLSANPTKWLNILKQIVGCCRQIVWVCLTILWDWRLNG